MSRNHEDYSFSLAQKEEIRERQKGICPGCSKKTKLTIHHQIPQWWARENLQPTQEVKDYIKNTGNGLGLCRQCHDKLEETIEQEHDIMIEVVTYVLGANSLLERKK